MSVKNAAQVLSATVAQDIEDQNWKGTSELVRFIRYVNKFFDCLNGAYAAQGTRTRNENLAPYTDVDDQRFDWLGVPNPNRSEPKYPSNEKPFLQYLDDWKSEADKSNKSSKEKEKMQLASQTLVGIEMSIKGFADYVRFLLNLEEPPRYLQGRDTQFRGPRQNSRTS
ncbi:Fukutin [Frankliniella fusca]|uniref:Fukutin n=1 Tax=Frankliniella fusca TaxID=407009 RepID=A0AAE1GVM7_9NEOP|nr:Fukutin [Frankliniella fusca]